jgi:hypothetical protein
MPKDEFDLDDPMELNGVGFVCDEDTTEVMTECFIEEFIRLGHNHRQIFALFRNPHYLGMNLALQKRGEQFVREKIADVFARWGRSVVWTDPALPSPAPASSTSEVEWEICPQPVGESGAATDPLGAPVPKLHW